MVNNVIFTDLKRQEAQEKVEEDLSRFQQPVMRYGRSKSFSYRRRSSVGLRRASVARRKSINPLCIRVRFTALRTVVVSSDARFELVFH